jgi:hypothetical protein
LRCASAPLPKEKSRPERIAPWHQRYTLGPHTCGEQALCRLGPVAGDELEVIRRRDRLMMAGDAFHRQGSTS